MKRKFVISLAIFILSLVVTCSYAGNDTLTVASFGDLRSLDPLQCSENVTGNALLQMFETLVYVNSDGKIEPMLAEKWEQPEPLTYLFYLKKGVKFHNGDECTAEDVKFTLDRAQRPVGVNAYALIKDMKSVEAVDKYTVRINMKKPVTPFLFALGDTWAGVVNKKAVEIGTHMTNPVGTGPFKFVSWKRSNSITLERFEDYHGIKPSFRTLVIKVVPEALSRTIELQSGAADVAINVHYSDFKRIEEDSKLKLIRIPTNRVEYIVLNNDRQELKDVRVRKAIKLALDIPAMQRSALRGVGYVTGSPLPHGMRYSLKEAPMPVQDIEGSKKLLKEAGIVNTKFDLIVFEHKERMDAAVIIQNMLEEVGIRVNIKVLELGTFFDVISKGDFDMAMTGWGNNLPDADYFFGRTLHSDSIGGNNYSRYSNPGFDVLLDKGLETPDGPERADIYAEAQRIILEEVPVIFWSVGEGVVGINVKVRNFEADPRNMFRFWLADVEN